MPVCGCVRGCDLLVCVRVRVRVGVAVRSKQMSSECVEKAGKVQQQPLLLRLPRSCHSTSVRVVMLMLLLLLTLALCHAAAAERTRARAARRELFITLQ